MQPGGRVQAVRACPSPGDICGSGGRMKELMMIGFLPWEKQEKEGGK